MRRQRVVILFLAVALLFSGCASFRSGNLPAITQWPPENAVKGKSISVIVSGESSINGKEQEVNSLFIKNWSEQVTRAYQDSGLFTEVKPGLSDTDLKAEVRIIDRGEANLGLAFLTGLTLYLIPSSATDEITIKTSIKNKDGDTLGTFEKSETITMWQQLFLIFAMPGNFPLSVTKETLYDVNRATITEAHSKGSF